MPDSLKLTKTQRRALDWFAARDVPASMFGAGDPGLAMVRRLCKAGLVERVGHDPGVFGFVRYAISQAGREALKDPTHG